MLTTEARARAGRAKKAFILNMKTFQRSFLFIAMNLLA